MLFSINSFFDFVDWKDCKVKTIKIQKQLFYEEDRELSKCEYKRLLKCAASKNKRRLFCIMQTLGATGIRISELKYITVEAVMSGRVEVHSKGKYRTKMLPGNLCVILKKYIKNERNKKRECFCDKIRQTYGQKQYMESDAGAV